MPRTDQGPVRLAANKKEQEFHDALAGAFSSVESERLREERERERAEEKLSTEKRHR